MVDAVTGVQFYSPEEWNLTVAADLTRLDIGECAFYVRGLGLCYGRLPLSMDRLAKTPKTARRRIAADNERLLQSSWFMSPEDIDRQRRVFFQSLLRELRRALRHPLSGSVSTPNIAISGQQQSGLILRPASSTMQAPLSAPEPIEEPNDDSPWEF